MTTKFNRFDLPYYEKPDDNTPEMMDVLAIGKDCDVFRLKKESLIKKIPVNISDSNNNNLFHLILRDDLKKTQTATINFFKYLLQNNTNPEQPNSDNRTPLHFAAMNQHDKIIEYLLEIGCNPNFKDNFGMTPLHYLMSGKFKVFKNNQVKFIKNYSNKLDIKKNDKLQKIQQELAKHLLKVYGTYFKKLNQIIAGLSLDGELAKKLAAKIREYGSLALDTSESSSKRLQLIKEARSIIEQKVTSIMNINSIKLNTTIRIKDNEDNVGIEKKLTVPGGEIEYYIIDKWDIDKERKKIGDELYEDEMKEIIEGLVDNVLKGELNLYTDEIDDEIDDVIVESYFDAIIRNKDNSTDIQQNTFVKTIKDYSGKEFFEKFHNEFNGYDIKNIINIIIRLNNKKFPELTKNEISSKKNIRKTFKFLQNIFEFILRYRKIRKNKSAIKGLLIGTPIQFNDDVATRFSTLNLYIKSEVNNNFSINTKEISKIFNKVSFNLNNLKNNKDFYVNFFYAKVQTTISTLIKLVNEYSTANKDSKLKSIKDEFEQLTTKLENYPFLKQTPVINYFNAIISRFNKINLYRLISDFVGFTNNTNGINIELDSFYNFILPLVDENLEFKEGEDIKDTDIFYNSNNTNNDSESSNKYDDTLKIKTEQSKFSENNDTNLKIIKDHQTRVSTLIEYFIKLIIHDFNEAIDNNTNPDKKGLFVEIKKIYEDNINLDLGGGYEGLNELNQKKFLIDIIINTVKNILSNNVNNKVVQLTRTSFGGTSPIQTPVLDVVNSSEMRIELASDLNDIESGITETNINNKKFIIFSDDYSNLEIEKELLELQISKDSFKQMLQSGASIFHPDKNGKYPVDLMVDNKYFCLAEVLANNQMKNVFKKDYLDETIENHFSLFKKETIYKNQQNDIIELIESNDDYNFKFNGIKESFKEVDEKSKDEIFSSLSDQEKTKIGNFNKEINETGLNSMIATLQPIYQNCIKYFTGSKYTNNSYKGKLQQILKDSATNFLKDHIKKFIEGNIKAYYKANGNDVINLTNFFTAGTFRGMSVNNLLNKLIDDFIKNSCRLFEDEDEELSHDNKRAGELFDNFFDEVATNEFIPMTFDSKLLKILKDNTKNYFEPFVYKLLQNYMVIYENNLKFIINHYRLLKIKNYLN